jgi:hypothetical protein
LHSQTFFTLAYLSGFCVLGVRSFGMRGILDPLAALALSTRSAPYADLGKCTIEMRPSVEGPSPTEERPAMPKTTLGRIWLLFRLTGEGFVADDAWSRGAAGSRGWAAKPAHCLSAKPYWVKAPTR